MNEVVEHLNDVVTEWQKTRPTQFPEVDWSKMRMLEFQESLRSRDALAARLEGKSCVFCEHFDEHVRRRSYHPLDKALNVLAVHASPSAEAIFVGYRGSQICSFRSKSRTSP